MLPPNATYPLEVAVQRFTKRDIELRKWVIDCLQFQLAALRKLHGARTDLWSLGEEAIHLLGRLDIELLRIKLEPLGVVHRVGCLYAKQNLVCTRVLVFDVVRVVG